jgi:hypothetical protein
LAKGSLSMTVVMRPNRVHLGKIERCQRRMEPVDRRFHIVGVRCVTLSAPIRTATPSSAAAVARDKLRRFIVVSLNNTHHMKRAFGPVATRS